MIAAVALLAGCEGLDDPGAGSPGGGASAASDGHAVSPLDNPDGTEPGLAGAAAGPDGAAHQVDHELAAAAAGHDVAQDLAEAGVAGARRDRHRARHPGERA